ncbi:hypothetical protein RD792_016246 [Penstemon davidsonii]|uniref:TF-B3 domain-containing protein n=1 Tax=Penstemon davidsonii TaxID=160366 RepID=A0ABR0CJQ9_9LAMI|nr:hypothetical protein RD792_016246 [Penstemon davidsonii]
METKKFKEKLYDDETHNYAEYEIWCSDASDCPPPKKKKKPKKKKEKIAMQMDTQKKDVSVKPKSNKSKNKNKQGSSSNSKKTKSIVRKRTRNIDVYDDVEAKFSVMERAERILSRLGDKLPHFVKCMLPSNVAHGFWLHLPAKFCNLHLPDHDTSIVLVDEWGNEYKTSYLLGRHGLSAGWRGFSISHRLLKGDLLIFHLIEPCKLKVHIVRVNDSDVVSAALCLMNLDASSRGTDSDNVKKDNRKRKKTKYVEPFMLNVSTPEENVKGKSVSNSILEPVACHSTSNSDGFSSEILEGCEIPNQLQPNDLCYSRAPFLHDHPREVLTCR